MGSRDSDYERGSNSMKERGHHRRYDQSRSRSPRRNDSRRRRAERNDYSDDSDASRSAPRRHHSRRDRDSRHHDRDDGRARRRHDEHRHPQSSSRRENRHHDRSRSRSRSPSRKKRPSSSTPEPHRRSRAPLPSQENSFRGELTASDPTGASNPPAEKQKPNYKPTGLLAKEANTVKGTKTVLKYNEPPEARVPSGVREAWRMYVFEGQDLIDTVRLHERSAWRVGRDTTVNDLVLTHGSISKQHAVVQFRHITTTDEFGERRSSVKPYVIDLESANGTILNGETVKTSRYVELRDQDVLKFGDLDKEYVMMLPKPSSGADK